jgi:hypothetical protein
MTNTASRVCAVLLLACALESAWGQSPTHVTRPPSENHASQITEYDGHWWLLLTSEEKSGYLSGDADCYRFELKKKFAYTKPAAEVEESITNLYRDNSDDRSVPVYEAIRIADRQPALRPPARGGEVWNERHGYWDGQWWREGTPADRLGFVEGYLACYSRSQKPHGAFSRTPPQYVRLVNQWYELNEETGDVDPTRVDAKIAAVLFKFVDSAAIGALSPATGGPAQKQTVSISIRSLAIGSGERVVGFDFEVTSGRIAQIPNAPIGWNISVNNDPSWKTRIEGSIIVAAAAVDASFFDDFMTIEKDESLGIPFGIQGEVVVSKDFSNMRRIKLEQKNFTMNEIGTQTR